MNINYFLIRVSVNLINVHGTNDIKSNYTCAHKKKLISLLIIVKIGSFRKHKCHPLSNRVENEQVVILIRRNSETTVINKPLQLLMRWQPITEQRTRRKRIFTLPMRHLLCKIHFPNPSCNRVDVNTYQSSTLIISRLI